jgi:threonine dehydrogenase-like Zn-dependent dehydrogenase
LALAGAQVTAIDINEQRLAFCQRLWPTLTCINSSGLTSAQLASRFGDDLPTAVFEATGNPESMQSAFNYVAYGGRMTFVGLFTGDVTFHDPLFHSREVTLLASRNALPDDFSTIIAALEAQQFDPTPWVTHRTSFAHAVEVFPHWMNPRQGVVKGLIAMDE